MSFNKRFFNQENITRNSKQTGFNGFDNWVLNPDACFSSDQFSHVFLSVYGSLPKGYRKYLHSLMGNIENVDLLFSILKLLKINYHDGNNDFHKKSIERYNDLFFIHWRNHINPSQAHTITKIMDL